MYEITPDNCPANTRLLMKAFDLKNPIEITITEWSPSGNLFKDASGEWRWASYFTLVEILPVKRGLYYGKPISDQDALC